MAHLNIFTCDFCGRRMDEAILTVETHGPATGFGELADLNGKDVHMCAACAPRFASAMGALLLAGHANLEHELVVMEITASGTDVVKRNYVVPEAP